MWFSANEHVYSMLVIVMKCHNRIAIVVDCMNTEYLEG